MWKDVFGEWGSAFGRKRWYIWIIAILIYKLIENSLLNYLQGIIQSNSSWFATILSLIAKDFSWIFTWMPVVIVIVALFILTYLDIRKRNRLLPTPQTGFNIDQADEKATIGQTILAIKMVSFYQHIYGIDSSWALIVSNQGDNEAIGCQGFLEKVVIENPLPAHSKYQWPKRTLLQWELDRHKIPQRTIDIPSGGSVVLELIQHRPLSVVLSAESFYFSLFGSDTLRATLPIPRESELKISVSIESKNTPKVYAICSVNSHYAATNDSVVLLSVQETEPIL